MDLARDVADRLIRRDLVLAGLAVGVALLGLCYDTVLLSRGGAVLVAGGAGSSSSPRPSPRRTGPSAAPGWG